MKKSPLLVAVQWIVRGIQVDHDLAFALSRVSIARRSRYARMVRSEPVSGELVIGWSAHYAIGITCAVLLLAVWGLDWVRPPTLLPALIVGVGTILNVCERKKRKANRRHFAGSTWAEEPLAHLSLCAAHKAGEATRGPVGPRVVPRTA